MVITASKLTRRKRRFCSKVVTNSTKNDLNGRVETRKFLSFARIVDKIKRQLWHQFHPNPESNIHKNQEICVSLFLNKYHEFHCCFQRSELVAKVNAPVQRSSAFLRNKLLIVLRPETAFLRFALYARKLDFPAKIKMNTFLKYSGKYSFSNW